MKQLPADAFEHLVEHYLGLESLEVTEELLDLCGASIDAHALPLLRRRLHEEEAALPQFEARGYVRLREKGEQLVTPVSFVRARIASKYPFPCQFHSSPTTPLWHRAVPLYCHHFSTSARTPDVDSIARRRPTPPQVDLFRGEARRERTWSPNCVRAGILVIWGTLCVPPDGSAHFSFQRHEGI